MYNSTPITDTQAHHKAFATLFQYLTTESTYPPTGTGTPLVIVSAINTSQGPEEVRNITATGFEICWLRAEPDTIPTPPSTSPG